MILYAFFRNFGISSHSKCLLLQETPCISRRASGGKELVMHRH